MKLLPSFDGLVDTADRNGIRDSSHGLLGGEELRAKDALDADCCTEITALAVAQTREIFEV